MTSSWQMINDFASLVATLTGVAAVFVAWRGVSTWRDEMIGRRRAELAEEVLADFYRARDIISDVRHPGSYPEH